MCPTCAGTGKLCVKCFNNGITVNTREACNCGMAAQKGFFWELQSLQLQNLVVPNLEANPKESPVYKSLKRLEKDDYRWFVNHRIRTRFCYILTPPDDFIVERFRLLRELSNEKKLIRRGFVYVSAPELVDAQYRESVEKIIQANRHSVLVYTGLSHMLHQSTFPFLPFISKNLVHPSFFFATKEWYEAYAFLNLLWIDKNQKEG